MYVRPLELPENISGATYGVMGFIATIVVLAKMSRRPNLDAFPTVGSSTWLGSWWAAFKYLTHAQDIIQEGYEKHKSAPFKVAELNHWTIILSNRRHLEELAKASNEEFSFLEAVDDQLQIRYTLGPEIIDNPYHIAVVRSRLTRNIQAIYPEIRGEIVTSLDEVFDLKGNEWKCIPVLSTMEKVICRTINRPFVGLSLCRNHEWVDLNIRYTIDAIKGGVVVGLFPAFMRPLATRFLTNFPRIIALAARLLGPIIEERQKYLREYGAQWDDKPNDLLSWLMEEAEGPELTTERLINRILVVNFASLHSSSNLFSQILFYLAANPQYTQPLRQEVESIIEEDGWTKAALRRMRKVDSFLKECQRIEGLNIVTLARKAMKDFTFSDGTFVPKGTYIAAAALSVHHDRDNYSNPRIFNPFRFANVDEEDGMGLKFQFASTTTEYLPFGHGTHACPGRFFAANELKTLLAHIVIAYDVKLEDNANFPTSWRMGTLIGAHPQGKIMIRKRIS